MNTWISCSTLQICIPYSTHLCTYYFLIIVLWEKISSMKCSEVSSKFFTTWINERLMFVRFWNWMRIPSTPTLKKLRILLIYYSHQQSKQRQKNKGLKNCHIKTRWIHDKNPTYQKLRRQKPPLTFKTPDDENTAFSLNFLF